MSKRRSFQKTVTLRGQPVEVRGYIEPADPSVGIMGEGLESWEFVDPTHDKMFEDMTEQEDEDVCAQLVNSMPENE